MTSIGTKYAISVGKSRTEMHWRNRKIGWERLCELLSNATKTKETIAEYKAMTKTQRGAVKDVGGFVGGSLIADGPRSGATIETRSLISLDIDNADSNTRELVRKVMREHNYAYVLYSTHSHTPEAPRYRLIIPMWSYLEPVTPDKYQPIARRVASWIGMDLMDDSTYEVARLMYWPSVSSDGEYIYDRGEGEDCDPDEVLATYTDPTNPIEWPKSSRIERLVSRSVSKAEDPTQKPGIIGAFCRVYGIEDAIDAFLPDKYERVDSPGSLVRYTYKGGSTVGGAIVYDDKWLYSHHGTDPCCCKLCNSFDLVRNHLFGSEDMDALEDTPINRLPSYTKMTEFCQKDVKVRKMIMADKIETVNRDFEGLSGVDSTCQNTTEIPSAKAIENAQEQAEWMSQFQLIPNSTKIASTPHNFRLICENDPGLKDTVKFNMFTNKYEITRSLPWRNCEGEQHYWCDADDVALIDYVSSNALYYSLGLKVVKQTLLDAHQATMNSRSYHPVRDYLSRLKWDGRNRVETMIIDYLGAKDDALTRAITKMHLVAAVARIFNPGCKYDYVLTMAGPEGIGKSTLIAKLAGQWFDDCLGSIDIKSKEAMEHIHGGVWHEEMAELVNYDRAENETFKGFVSRTQDCFRASYGRHKETHLRKLIFWATTNNLNFLRGDQGNRRFMPISVGEALPRKSVFVDMKNERDQIWAEAVELFKHDTPIYLDSDMEALARERQRSFNEIEIDERKGIIEAFIATPVPSNWYTLPRAQRQDWFKYGRSLEPGDNGIRREYICVAELENECFRRPVSRYEARDINAIMKTIEGLEYVGSMRTKDLEYGNQRRFRISATLK